MLVVVLIALSSVLVRVLLRSKFTGGFGLSSAPAGYPVGASSTRDKQLSSRIFKRSLKLNSPTAFLCLLVSVLAFPAAAKAADREGCSAFVAVRDSQLVSVQVKRVIDGDTVVLADDQHVRLIGINTPEMNYGKGAPQPYAVDAKQALQRMVTDSKQLYLSYGSEKKDHYGRALAHLYGDHSIDSAADGSLDAPTNFAALLLGGGLGFFIAIPPNLAHSSCFQQLEFQARANQLGLWRGFSEQIVKPGESLKTGFQLVTGRIVNVAHDRAAWWLAFDGPLVLRVNVKHMRHFDEKMLLALIGETITARGWIKDRGIKYNNHPKGYRRWMMNVSHPLSIAEP